MEATAGIRTDKDILFVKLSHLQAAEIAAGAYGFYDLDVDTDDRGRPPGGVRIVASAHKRQVTAYGPTMEKAVEKLLEMFKG